MTKSILEAAVSVTDTIVNESLTRIFSTQPIPLAEGKYLGSGGRDLPI
jgi:hypothetical protein